MFNTIRLAALSIVALLLGSCGGGGGDAPPAGVTLSGSIAVAETAAVDSDTNDPNQAGYSINDDGPRAQPLASPVLLVGTVNKPNTGPQGTNFTSGDPSDAFRITLAAGQVVELEFSADPANADVDLGLITVDGTQIGASAGVTTRFECVEVATSGEYFVVVFAFRSASIYNLRIGAPGTAAPCAQRTAPANFAPTQLLALPRAGATERERAQSLQRRAGLVAPAQSQAIPQLLTLPSAARERAAGLRALGAASRSRDVASEAPWGAAFEVLHYAKHLQASGAYVYVQPNYVQQRLALTGTYPPDDRNYSYQRWHYEQINLPSAMSRIHALPSQPAQRPIAAIIDDGVVIDHPDLAPQLFSNGRAFISNASSGDGNLASANDPSAAGDSPVFHGTHVAGTVGAATFDGIGAAGVAPMAQLLPLRVFAPGRGAGSNDIINAMLYAARLPNNSNTLPARRADVINLSLGSDGACQPAFQDTIDKVRSAGVMVVVAAGNSGRNDIGQRVAVGNPANCNGAIGVSATDNRKAVTSYSNTGAQIVVAAPGGDTSQSTTGNGAPDGIYSDLGSFDAQGVRQPSFGPLQGTSMAAPHVAGVIALMRYVNPALTPADIDSLFQQGALTDDLGPANRDIDFGFGLINARKAVDAALEAVGNPPPPPPGQILATPSSIDFGSFQSTATLELKASGVTGDRVTTITSDSPAVTVAPATVDATTKLGSYTVTVNRNALAGTGSFFPKLTVSLASLGSLSVQLSITKSTSGNASGNLGPVYVFLVDPDASNAVVATLRTTHSNGRYTWSFGGYTRSRVAVVAGGDLDNNRFICQRGEPCGAFPVLEATGRPTPITLNGNRGDLNFRIAPLSGISAQTLPEAPLLAAP